VLVLLAVEPCAVKEFRVLVIKAASRLCHQAVCHQSRVPSKLCAIKVSVVKVVAIKMNG
jgi:hypothetical protein